MIKILTNQQFTYLIITVYVVLDVVFFEWQANDYVLTEVDGENAPTRDR